MGSWVPLLRFLALVVVLGGAAAAVGWLLGPVGLGITSATGVAGAAVRQLGVGRKKRRT